MTAQRAGLRYLTHRAGLSFVGGRWEWDDEIVSEQGRPVRAILRSAVGHLCGYVRVPDDHPIRWLPDIGFDFAVHGGLTWNGAADWLPPGHWLGFDCGHSGDLSPGGLHEPAGVREDVNIWAGASQTCDRAEFGRWQRDTHGTLAEVPQPWREYRPIAYVRAEVDKLEAAVIAVESAEDGFDA